MFPLINMMFLFLARFIKQTDLFNISD